jgi:hypothetical protein
VSELTVEAILETMQEACEFDADLESVALALERAPGSVLPVLANRRTRLLVGEVSERCLEAARSSLGPDYEDLRASDIARPAVLCRLDDTPEAALAIMRAHRRWILHVVDSRGALCGFVSIEAVYANSDPVARAENAPGTIRLALAAVPARVLEKTASTSRTRRAVAPIGTPAPPRRPLVY